MNYIWTAIFGVSTLLLVFRAHYFSDWINIILVLTSAILFGLWIEPLIDFLSANRERPKLKKVIERILGIAVIGLFFAAVFYVHTQYISFAMHRTTVLSDATIDKAELWRSKRGTNRYVFYSYTVNGKVYNNQIRDEQHRFEAGDVVQLKVSAFDPTVTNLNQ